MASNSSAASTSGLSGPRWRLDALRNRSHRTRASANRSDRCSSIARRTLAFVVGPPSGPNNRICLTRFASHFPITLVWVTISCSATAQARCPGRESAHPSRNMPQAPPKELCAALLIIHKDLSTISDIRLSSKSSRHTDSAAISRGRPRSAESSWAPVPEYRSGSVICRGRSPFWPADGGSEVVVAC